MRATKRRGSAHGGEFLYLDRCVNIKAPGQVQRVVRNNRDGPAFHAGESADDVLGIGWHDFEDAVAVNHLFDHRGHVITHVRVVRHEVVESGFFAVARVVSLDNRRLV